MAGRGGTTTDITRRPAIDPELVARGGEATSLVSACCYDAHDCFYDPCYDTLPSGADDLEPLTIVVIDCQFVISYCLDRSQF